VVITPGAGAAAVAEGAIGMTVLAYDPVSEPPAGHPLFCHPDVVLTPHLMGLSRRAGAATFTAAAQGILDVLDGPEPRAVANPGWRTGRPADSKEISV
jgi:phosphoglycerate dehydrogenase-like enzyme